MLVAVLRIERMMAAAVIAGSPVTRHSFRSVYSQIISPGDSATGSLTLITLLVFFFSSRRRHTRSTRDWSSDVCSSDLLRLLERQRAPLHPARLQGRPGRLRHGRSTNR